MRTLLQAPLCYAPGGRPTGTLKSLHAWCAARRAGLRLHFAKTGTQVTEDPDATVDAWIAGGLQFANGAAYSYVVVVGTGAASEPWARKLHAAQVAAPLLEALLEDLEADARAHPRPDLLRAHPRAPRRRLVAAKSTSPHCRRRAAPQSHRQLKRARDLRCVTSTVTRAPHWRQKPWLAKAWITRPGLTCRH